MTEHYDTCIWCPGMPKIPASQFDEHLDRAHPSISDPRNSTSCWSRSEVCTPDGLLRKIACGRGRHRWGKHRNRDVRWVCPPRCSCIRHARGQDRAQPANNEHGPADTTPETTP